MTESKDIKKFYEADLRPIIRGLEKIKPKKESAYSKASFFGIIAVVFGLLGMIAYHGIDFLVVSAILFMIAAGLAGAALYTMAVLGGEMQLFRKRYKARVVNRIVNFVNPEWIYEPNRSITQNEFINTKMFEHKVNHYDGDDLVTGIIEDTVFKYSEVHAAYKKQTSSQSNSKKYKVIPIMDGLVITADFNKYLKAETIVVGKAKLGGQIKLENLKFNSMFDVKATDDIEARYVLTPVMMESLIALKEQFKTDIRLSFLGSNVNIAIPFKGSLFEPKYEGPSATLKSVRYMQSLFNIIYKIVHEMQLNTRIWTKAPSNKKKVLLKEALQRKINDKTRSQNDTTGYNPTPSDETPKEKVIRESHNRHTFSMGFMVVGFLACLITTLSSTERLSANWNAAGGSFMIVLMVVIIIGFILTLRSYRQKGILKQYETAQKRAENDPNSI